MTALGEQELLPQEVVVVGRAGDEAARRVIETAQDRLPVPLRWVLVDGPGHLAPVRRGLREVTGEIVVLLDDDAEPELGWLKALTEPFRNPDVACVGGRYTYEDSNGDGLKARSIVKPGLRWYGRFDGHFPPLDKPVEVDAVLEGTSAWRRDVLCLLEWPEVFNSGDAIYYGLDLCLQVKRLGYKVIYVPYARTLHHMAPRADGMPARCGQDRAEQSGRNLTYIALTRLAGVMRVTFLLGFSLVGHGQSPGLAVFLRDLVFGREDPWGRFRAAVQGR
ncbi:MAG: hypothetical protein AUI36_12925, partial [Cyanobacteria bacterium 13_1_40CM_2_61_4]